MTSDPDHERTATVKTKKKRPKTGGNKKVNFGERGRPGWTPEHVEALKAFHRGLTTPERIAKACVISTRLAKALLDDLVEGNYIKAAK